MLRRQYSELLRSPFDALQIDTIGQYGEIVKRGTEMGAEQAAIGYQRGGTVLSCDGLNAFNSVKRPRMLPAVSKSAPPPTDARAISTPGLRRKSFSSRKT